MAPRGGKRGTRGSIAPVETPEEEPEDPQPTYRHAVSLERPAPAAARAEMLPARTGADMPETLEAATWLMRERVAELWRRYQAEGELNPKQWGEVRAMMDPLSKLGREVRAWRKLQAEEVGAFDDAELARLLPHAAAALGIELPDEEE